MKKVYSRNSVVNNSPQGALPTNRTPFSRLFPLLCLCCLLTGCNVFKSSSKYQFSDGYYKMMAPNGSQAQVYVEHDEDSVFTYPAVKAGNTYAIADSTSKTAVQPGYLSKNATSSFYFRKKSLDIDFLTSPLKYRPTSRDFPRQLNSDVNGAIYFGYREDVYQLGFDRSLTGKLSSGIGHHSYSIGAFAGIGSTFMSPWVTEYNIDSEYTGVVFTKGVAAIFGVNAFTFGLALGFDNLLDRHNPVWIYEDEPWLGLVFGLSLN